MRGAPVWMLWMFAACGGAKGESGVAEGDADTDTDTDADSDADTDADSDTDATEPELAAFAFLSDSGGDPYLSVAFYDFGAVPDATVDTQTTAGTFGDCEVWVAHPTSGTPTGGGETVFLDPGEPTVTLDGTAVPLTRSTDFWSATLAGWPAGEVLGFGATGNEFPAFDLPDLLVVPERMQAGPLPDQVDRADDLVLTWDPADTEFFSASIGSGYTTVYCSFDDTAGTGTVPADALALLDAGQALGSLTRFRSAFEFLPDDVAVAAYAFTSTSWTIDLR